MNALLHGLARFMTPRRFALLLVLEAVLLAVENGLRFPLSVPYMREVTGGHVYLDMCAFCSAPRVQGELAAFGAAGRGLQLALLPTVDVLIPAMSGLTGAAGLITLAPPRMRPLALIPLVATTLDFAENAGIATLVLRYPARLDAVAAVTGVLTGLKFMAYLLTVLLMALLGARRLYARRAPRSTPLTSAGATLPSLP